MKRSELKETIKKVLKDKSLKEVGLDPKDDFEGPQHPKDVDDAEEYQNMISDLRKFQDALVIMYHVKKSSIPKSMGTGLHNALNELKMEFDSYVDRVTGKKGIY